MPDLNKTKNENNLKEALMKEQGESMLCLESTKGVKLKLNRVFVTEYNDSIYCILAPVNQVKGLKKGTALTFELKDEHLRLVTDKELTREVFKLYYSSLIEG